MNTDLAFHDTVLEQIDAFIAAHAPERGGALLGPIGHPVVSEFVPDPAARVTGSTYEPSDALRARITEREQADHTLEFKGIIHSHPGRLARPSSGDQIAFANNLRISPWLGRFVCPIITERVADADHRLQLRHGTLSAHVAEPRATGEAVVTEAVPRVLPIGRDTALLAETFNARVHTAGLHASVDGTLYALAVLEASGVQISALYPSTYPTLPPIVLLTPTGDEPAAAVARLIEHYAAGTAPVSLPLRWDQRSNDDTRLRDALAEIQGAGALASPEPERAPAFVEQSQQARDGISSRLGGAVGEGTTTARVMIVGLGSGGSQTAEGLVRSGVRELVLVDDDVVGAENLSRTTYVIADVGRPKTDALAERLRAIDPGVELDTRAMRLERLPLDDLSTLVQSCDLIVAATDDPATQLRLNHTAWVEGVPAVFGGVYARGLGGEVVFTVPGLTRCFRCATSRREVGVAESRGVDYGTGRLLGEPALGADIAHIVSASIKIAIGLLELGGSDGAGNSAATLVSTALARRLQFLLLSTVAEYGFFPRVFEGVPGQHGYQSVWMSVQGDESCATCGTGTARPGTDLLAAPDLDALREATQRAQSTPRDTDAEDVPAPRADNEPGPDTGAPNDVDGVRPRAPWPLRVVAWLVRRIVWLVRRLFGRSGSTRRKAQP